MGAASIVDSLPKKGEEGKTMGVLLVGFDPRKYRVAMEFSHLCQNPKDNPRITFAENLYELFVSKDEKDMRWAIDFVKTNLHSGNKDTIKHVIYVLLHAVYTPQRKEKIATAMAMAREMETLDSLRENGLNI